MREALRDRWLIVLMAGGLALRVAFAAWLHPAMRPLADEAGYLAVARIFAETGALETGDFVRPPLYFVWLGGLAWLAPTSLALTAKLLQAVIGTLVAIPVYRSALRIGGRRAARFAAAFLVFDPTLVAYAHLLWPETLYLAVVAFVFDASARLRPDRPSAAIGLGIGVAMLLKPVFGLYSLVLAAGWWRRFGTRGALRLALLAGVTAAIVVAPWAARNVSRYGPAVWMENQGPYNLWVANDPQDPVETLREWKALGDPVTRSRVGMERGLAAIQDDPGRFAASGVDRIVSLWGLEFFVVRNVIAGAYGPTSKAGLLATFWALAVGWVAVFLFAALGLPRVLRDPALRSVFVYALVMTALVAAMVATTRFRIPFAFALAVAAGVGLEELLRERRVALRSGVCAAIAVLVLVVSASRPLFVQIATGGFERVAELHTMNRFMFRL